jgi:hypothetical protein
MYLYLWIETLKNVFKKCIFVFSEPVVGLDPKYFEHSTPGGTLTRLQIPDVNSLPSNVRRPAGGGGLVRRTLDSVPDIL